MTDKEGSLLRHISSRLKTSSAVVPALLISLIAMPIGAAGMLMSASDHTIYAIVLLSPLAVVLGQILFFSAYDRDRLHNEEHIERRMQLDQHRTVIGNNDTGSEVLIEGQSVRSLEGPESKP